MRATRLGEVTSQYISIKKEYIDKYSPRQTVRKKKESAANISEHEDNLTKELGTGLKLECFAVFWRDTSVGITKSHHFRSNY